MVRHDVEVADGVVALGVDDVHQRRYLRKSLMQSFEHRLANRPVVAEEGEHHHQVARRRESDDERAQKALLAAQVEIFETMRLGIVANPVADGIRRLGLQMTLGDVDHLVEQPRHVEAEAGLVVVQLGVGHLIGREPALVRKRELQFVPIIQVLLRRHHRHLLRQFDVADARQIVPDLRRLEFKLPFVGDVLPFASAALPEMPAHGLHPDGRIGVEGHGLALVIAAAFARHLHVHHVARHGIGHKDHPVVDPRNGLALGRHACHFHIEQHRLVFSRSSHAVSFWCRHSRASAL